MSELREQIQAVLTNDVAGQSGQVGWSDEADRILALIAEAMLSEDSRAVNVVAGVIGERDGRYPIGDGFYFSIAEDVLKVLSRYLTAAGITGANTTD